MRGDSNVDTLRTSQKSCVGTAGSEGEGAKGLAVCFPISPGIGSEMHSSLNSQRRINAPAGGRDVPHLALGKHHSVVLPYLENQLCSLDPRRQVELTCLTTACWIVSSKKPLASVLVGVAVPDVGPSDCLLDILASIDTAKAR